MKINHTYSHKQDIILDIINLMLEYGVEHTYEFGEYIMQLNDYSIEELEEILATGELDYALSQE